MTRESEKSKIRMSVIVDGKHINSLKKADEVIDKIFDEHEAQLKAKDEEINSLKRDFTAWSMLLDDPQDVKARKICAMLFWEWRKHKQTLKEKRDEENNETPSRDSLAWFWIVAQSEMLFKKAYAMLKATT